MTIFQFLLDENVSESLRKALHLRWPEIVVWRAGDPAVPERGTLDPEILVWCEAHGFSLVINNRDSMPGHLENHLSAEKHVPGISTLSAGMTLRATADELALIWRAAEPEEFADQIHYLPLRK